MRISTGVFAKAIKDYFPASEPMVRAWCEEGLLKARRNPAKEQGHWLIMPDGIKAFLVDHLSFDPEEVSQVERKLGINFIQFKLAFAA